MSDHGAKTRGEIHALVEGVTSGTRSSPSGSIFALKARRDAAQRLVRWFDAASSEDRQSLVLQLCRRAYGVGGCRDALDVALSALASVPTGVRCSLAVRAIVRRMLQDPAHSLDREALVRTDVHMRGGFARQVAIEIRRVDPANCSAALRDFIIRYERVQPFADVDDFTARLSHPSRCCFALMHTSMTEEPLVFVQAFLSCRNVPPANIADILTAEPSAAPYTGSGEPARSVCFFAVTNTQPGLAGLQLGSYLLLLAVEEVRARHAGVSEVFTLSPLPGFRVWLQSRAAAGDVALLRSEEAQRLWPSMLRTDAVRGLPDVLAAHVQAQRRSSDEESALLNNILTRAAARYVLFERRHGGSLKALDPVANFHLQNGASVYRLNLHADSRASAVAQSFGVMVNYKYDLSVAGADAQRYASSGTLVASQTAMLLQAVGLPDILRGIPLADVSALDIPLVARVAAPGEWLVVPELPSTHAIYLIVLGRVELYSRDSATTAVQMGHTVWFPPLSEAPPRATADPPDVIYGGRSLPAATTTTAVELDAPLHPYVLRGVMRPGHTLGALPAVTGRLPTYAARAATTTYVFVVPFALLRTALEASPHLAEVIRRNSELQIASVLDTAAPRL